MRDLVVEPAGAGVVPALRTALSGGPALFVAAGAPPSDLPDRVEQRVAVVVETSGSTGRPRRVALSADALLANAGASESALGPPGEWVLALPTHYIAGINVLTRAFAAGTDPVAVPPGPFTAAGFLDAATRLELPDRYIALVPAQLDVLLADERAAATLRGFRAVLVGGQRTPDRLLAAARSAGVRVVRSYGSSETAGGCVYDGRPIGRTQLRIVDGEVWIGGPSLAEGYLGDPDLTAERFLLADGERWFRTADAGALEDGILTVTGRRDDVVISGGVKVALGEVERVLREQPGFADAVVVRGPHPRWGETPVAFTSGDADAAPALAAVAIALGKPARPDIRRVAAIPTLPSGKPDRQALTGLAETSPAEGPDGD